MMVAVYSVYQEIKKMVSNYAFYVAVFATVLICMSGTIVTEALTSESHNLIQFMLMNVDRKKELVEMYDLTFKRIFLEGSRGELWMFAPVFVSAPFVMLMCSAKKNNNIRFEICRMGKTVHVVSKGISAVLVAGLIISLGYGMFGIVLSVVLPKGEGLTAWLVMRRMLEMFFYGMCSVLLTFSLSGIMKNKYLVLCVPFMLNYLVKSILDKPGFSDNVIRQIINPTAPSYIFSFNTRQRILIVAYWSVLFVLCLTSYYFILNRRCDCGE